MNELGDGAINKDLEYLGEVIVFTASISFLGESMQCDALYRFEKLSTLAVAENRPSPKFAICLLWRGDGRTTHVESRAVGRRLVAVSVPDVDQPL